jgi:hypothetical protein
MQRAVRALYKNVFVIIIFSPHWKNFDCHFQLRFALLWNEQKKKNEKTTTKKKNLSKKWISVTGIPCSHPAGTLRRSCKTNFVIPQANFLINFYLLSTSKPASSRRNIKIIISDGKKFYFFHISKIAVPPSFTEVKTHKKKIAT